MKQKISFLTMIFSLSILMFFLTSSTGCDPFPSTNPDSNAFSETPQDDSKNLNPHVFPGPEIDWENIHGYKLNTTLSDALESINFDERSAGNVSIAASRCPQGGQALLVYSNNQPNLDFYNDDKFLVLWYKNGDFISEGPKLDCVCRGEYGVAVINLETHQGVGKARYLIRESCGVDDGTITTKSDNN